MKLQAGGGSAGLVSQIPVTPDQFAKPFSQACENNKQPILTILRRCFDTSREVLEIGSGTGQHAVFFARHLPHLVWQASDLGENLPGIHAWAADAELPNLRDAVILDISWETWPVAPVDAVFSANTLHIVSWAQVQSMFTGIAAALCPGGVCAIYGPFNYAGAYTSDSNARFDAWLRQRDPDSGIRNFEDVDALAGEAGLVIESDNGMPANNRLLVWRKCEG